MEFPFRLPVSGCCAIHGRLGPFIAKNLRGSSRGHLESQQG
ncbi:hypothetical protein ACVDG3_08495 [Meridianimarinicoccus sp. RP-17]